MINSDVLIAATNVTRTYGRHAETVALDGVSIEIRAGESLGIVGESGSGKTTLSRLLLGLEVASSGTVAFRGNDLKSLPKAEQRRYRHEIAAVFQNPYSSLDPRMRVWQIITEQMAIERVRGADQRKARAAELLTKVGLDERVLLRYPHQLSGGQRQRVAIARSLVSDPKVIVLDEAISSLDVSVRAQILNLLIDLRESLQVGYVFIAHDLAIVQHLCSRLVVLYRGKIVEEGPCDQLFSRPAHPYTAALIEASYLGDAELDAAPKLVTPAVTPALGAESCAFHARCAIGTEACVVDGPVVQDLGDGHRALCLRPLNRAAADAPEAPDFATAPDQPKARTVSKAAEAR
jgi:oligopeptide/dipeptide ABC transporter ATP-binding protein